MIKIIILLVIAILIVALVVSVILVIRHLRKRAVYMLAPPDEREAINFENELKEREKHRAEILRRHKQ